MNLKQVCHPLFQYICSLYRRQEKGQVPTEEKVRGEMRHCFESMRDSVLGNTILADQLSKIELPLVFFVDYMIKEGPFEFSRNWVELARDFNELSGDEKFFDMLDETLADPSPSATERITIFYTCIVLGFYGCYASDPLYLERKVKICALRTGLDGGTSMTQPFGRRVYETVSKENRFRDPGRATMPFLVVALLLLLLAVIANLTHYNFLVNSTRKRFHAIVNPGFANRLQKSQQFIQIESSYNNAENKQNNMKNKKSTPQNASTYNVRQYPQDEIQQSSWFPAYKAGTNLNEHYDVKKANAKKYDKGGTAPSEGMFHQLSTTPINNPKPAPPVQSTSQAKSTLTQPTHPVGKTTHSVPNPPKSH